MVTGSAICDLQVKSDCRPVSYSVLMTCENLQDAPCLQSPLAKNWHGIWDVSEVELLRGDLPLPLPLVLGDF